MKCVFISCFDNYQIRIKPIEEFMCNKGYTCQYITSNFDHIRKETYRVARQDSIQIKVPKYNKNLSIQRIVSHYFFSKKAYKKIKEIQPDLIYVMLPPNSLAMFMTRYKKSKNVKLIFDIYDMWPETFPSTKFKSLLKMPFKIWKGVRDLNLHSADLVITECELFGEKLGNVKSTFLYPVKNRLENIGQFHVDDKKIEICYLGSINNIIDIDLIIEFLYRLDLKKKVLFHLIGDGEKRESLIERLSNYNIEVIFYGKIYDDLQKKSILNRCMFGLNIMKETVCVGMTLKSLDYFQMGLPIINNISADTMNLIDENKIGFNLTYKNMDYIIEEIINLQRDEVIEMRKKTLKVFEENFVYEVLDQKLNDLFENELNIKSNEKNKD